MIFVGEEEEEKYKTILGCGVCCKQMANDGKIFSYCISHLGNMLEGVFGGISPSHPTDELLFSAAY